MRKFIVKYLEKLLVYLKPKSNVIEFKLPTGEESIMQMGRFASSLLKNPAFETAILQYEETLFRAWKLSDPKDEVAREKLYYQIDGLNQIHKKLNGMVSSMLYEKNQKDKAGNG